MKPFLVLGARPNDLAADGEYRCFLEHGGLAKEETHRVRLEIDGAPEVNLDNYSGVIVGGSPWCVSSTDKSTQQRRAEESMSVLFEQIVEKDIPYLGICYGLGLLATHLGVNVAKGRYSEPKPEPVTIKLNPTHLDDPLLRDLPQAFRAIAGHKESCQDVPEGAVVLASTDVCPIHILRYKQHIYATQFHPELDFEGMVERVNTYKNEGYFPPEQANEIIEACRVDLTTPKKVLANFVSHFRT